MAIGRLSEIIKARRKSGGGIAGSLVGGFKERLKEKFDPRRVFKRDGLLTSLFPSLMSYKSPTNINKYGGGEDSNDTMNPLLISIEKSTRIISKNSKTLDLIQRDTKLMKTTLFKLVKIMTSKKRGTGKSTLTDSTTSTEPTQLTGLPRIGDEDGESEGTTGIISAILLAVEAIKGVINKVVGFLKNLITVFAARILPILRTISIFASRFLPILVSFPVLVAAIAALAAYSIFKMGQGYRAGQEQKDELKYLRMLKRNGTISNTQLDRLGVLEKSGETASMGEGRQQAQVIGQAESGTGFAMFRELESGIKKGKTTESEADAILREETGYDLAMHRSYEKANKADPKINNSLIAFAANQGIESTKVKNIQDRTLTPEAKDAVYRNRSIGFGDELVDKLVDIDKIGQGATSVSAKTPEDVLGLIEKYKRDNKNKPNILANKTIFLSTGFQNSTGSKDDLQVVEKQISTLMSMGASDNAIKILGVTQEAKNSAEINAGLQDISSVNKSEFLAIPSKGLSKTFVSDTMLPANKSNTDDQGRGKDVADSLKPNAGTPPAAATAPTPISDSGNIGEFQAEDLAPSSSSPTAMDAASDMGGLQAENNAASLGDASNVSTLLPKAIDAKPLDSLDSGNKDSDINGATNSNANQTEYSNPSNNGVDVVREEKSSMVSPYANQHPQFNNMIRKLSHEYGLS